MPESTMTSGIACSAVNQTWFTNTRIATRRPAPGSVGQAATVEKKKRASAPSWESQRVTSRPVAAIGAVTRLRDYDCESFCKPSCASVYAGKTVSACLKSSVAFSLLPRSAYNSARE